MNAFLKFAAEQTPAAVKARQRATEKRRAKAAELAHTAGLRGQDGFDAYGDELDRRLLQGTQIKFTNAYTWVTRAGEEMPTDEEFIAVDVKRVEAKWTTDKNAPPQTRVLLPGEKFRDMKELNKETPKSEWREYNGQQKGPWEIQHYLYLLGRLLKRYTYVASTIGGNIAISELVQQVKDARTVYGPDTYAKVRLSDTWMKTSYSPDGRQRPHFIITGYRRRRGGRGDGKTGRAAQPDRIEGVGASRQADRETTARR